MPTIPCPNAITCPNGGDDPISNFSSEAIDSVEFLAVGYFLPPPRVYPFSPAIPTVGTPTIDGGGAGDPGTAATQTQGEENQRIINNTPPRPTPPAYPPQVVVTNDAQSCAYTCPDGTLSFFTVPVGTFFGTNKVLLNRQASAYACRQVSRHHTCRPPAMSLSTFSPKACMENHFSGTIVVSHASPPIDFEVSSGALPTGVLIGQTGTFSILVTGVPQTAGVYNFTVMVTDAVGQVATRAYEIDVLGITNPDLPDGTVGTPYAEAFTGAGGVGITFQLQSGTLPDGLSMNGSGVVTGTPTTAGVSDFTVGLTSADGNVCEVDCAINVTAATACDGIAVIYKIPGYNAGTAAAIAALFPAATPNAGPEWDGKFRGVAGNATSHNECYAISGKNIFLQVTNATIGSTISCGPGWTMIGPGVFQCIQVFPPLFCAQSQTAPFFNQIFGTDGVGPVTLAATTQLGSYGVLKPSADALTGCQFANAPPAPLTIGAIVFSLIAGP